MKNILLILFPILLFGCAPSSQILGKISKIEVQSVTVIDGVDGNRHITFSSSKKQKVHIKSDGEWVEIKVRVKQNVFKSETAVFYYRAEALQKYQGVK